MVEEEVEEQQVEAVMVVERLAEAERQLLLGELGLAE
jgi:hypothetical protein